MSQGQMNLLKLLSSGKCGVMLPREHWSLERWQVRQVFAVFCVCHARARIAPRSIVWVCETKSNSKDEDTEDSLRLSPLKRALNLLSALTKTVPQKQTISYLGCEITLQSADTPLPPGDCLVLIDNCDFKFDGKQS